MRASIDNFSFDGVGLIKDTPASDLPPAALTFGHNIYLEAGHVASAPGYETFATPSVAPHYLLPVRTTSNAWWIYAGLAKIHVTDGTTDVDLTRVSGDYTGSADNTWTGGSLGTIPILNNGVDVPQQWDGDSGNPMQDLENWPAGEFAKVVRPVSSFLVRCNITRGGIGFPQLIGWSSVADPGTVPNSWDPSDPTILAGERPLSGTDGSIVDFLELANNLTCVYKDDSVWAMRFVERSQEVFSFWKIGSSGILARNCIVNIPLINSQFVFGVDDVFLCDGRGIVSVLHNRWKNALFDSIDETYGFRSFAAIDSVGHKAFACYPERGFTFPNKALVYDWETQAIGIRDLPVVAYAAEGIANPSGITKRKWSDTPQIKWSDALIPWNDRVYNPMTKTLMQAMPDIPNITQIRGATFGGVVTEALMERQDFAFLPDRKGQFVKDIKMSKQWLEAWLDVEGSGVLEFYAGGRNVSNGPITYRGPFSFEIGTDDYIDLYEAGCWRYPAYKIRSIDGRPWKVKGISLEMKAAGDYY